MKKDLSKKYKNHVNFKASKNFSLLNQMCQKDVKVVDHRR